MHPSLQHVLLPSNHATSSDLLRALRASQHSHYRRFLDQAIYILSSTMLHEAMQQRRNVRSIRVFIRLASGTSTSTKCTGRVDGQVALALALTGAPVSEALQVLEFCHRMEGCSRGWRRSWGLPGWNMPGRCYKQRARNKQAQGGRRKGVKEGELLPNV